MQFHNVQSSLEIIKTIIKENSHIRGYQARLAKASGCSSSFFSRVVAGNTQMTMDQASLLCDFWGLNVAEAAFFLTLLLWERSRSESLRKRLESYHEYLREQLRAQDLASQEGRS